MHYNVQDRGSPTCYLWGSSRGSSRIRKEPTTHLQTRQLPHAVRRCFGLKLLCGAVDGWTHQGRPAVHSRRTPRQSSTCRWRMNLDAAPSSFPKLVARGILYMHVRIGLMLPLAKNVQFAVPFRVRTVKERTRLSDTTAKSIGSSVRSSLGLDCAEASTAAEHQI